MTLHPTFNPETDLKLERVVDVPVALVWRCWTEPALMLKWFTPAPFKTFSVDTNLVPGGYSNVVMESPDGDRFPNEGCYLVVEPERRLVFTDALRGDFRPAPKSDDIQMTAHIIMEPVGERQTRYTAYALHNSAEHRTQHEAMGFHDGWGAALDQLVALCKTL
ncbi:MAG: SRPBCC family protein [Dehalococcoidia bacterium]